MSWLRRLELLCWALGLLLLTGYLAARAEGTLSSRAGLERFERARMAAASGSLPAPAPADRSLWSESRIRAYERALAEPLDDPLAVLRIPAIRLEVPVWEGTGEMVLNRGVGRVAGTALPGEPGNLVIAGHRDGFFRGVKDLRLGDVLVLETLAGPLRYRIEDLLIVDPEEVEVLGPTSASTLTLVTCYPFYYVGKAPRRYIVRAALEQEGTVAAGPGSPEVPGP
jgi:sortase A